MYTPLNRINGKEYNSFTGCIAELFNPAKYDQLKKLNRDQQLINYTGNMENYLCLNRDALNEYDKANELHGIIENKIVLLGTFYPLPPLPLEDLHFTPLNEVISGKSFPD